MTSEANSGIWGYPEIYIHYHQRCQFRKTSWKDRRYWLPVLAIVRRHRLRNKGVPVKMKVMTEYVGFNSTINSAERFHDTCI